MSLSSPLSFLHRPWQRLTHRYGWAGSLLLLVLAAVLVTSVVYVAEAENPWGKAVQKRLAKGRELGVHEYRIIGLWWASLASAGATATLLAAARWWLPRTAPRELRERPSATPAWFWALLLAVTLFGAWERLPRLGHSLWNDEEYSMRSYSHGEWVHKDGSTTFKAVPWEETLFNNAHGNNHVFTATASRISLDIWRGMTGAAPDAFSETALRMPSFLSALLAIVVVGWLGLQMGGPAVGLTAAALLAISPWHIRYSAESKGYATMIAFMLVNLAAVLQALRGGQLRWWVLFALSEAVYLLCFAGSVYVAAAVNLLLAVDLLISRRRLELGTLIGFNMVGAIPVIWWMSPSVPQLIAYLHDENSPRLDMGWPWVRDLLSGWAIGWGHTNPLPELHLGTGWALEMASAGWGFKVLMLGLLPLLALLGVMAACRRPLSHYMGITAMTLAGAVAYAHTALKSHPMWVWYLIYTVIPMVLALPLGIQFLTRRYARVGSILMVLLVGSLTWANWNSTQKIRLHDRQPIRQTVASIRAQSPNALTATFGVSDRQAESYDHDVRVLKNPDELEALVAESRSRALPLYVYLCGESVTGPRHPEMYQRIKDSGEFEPLTHFPGTEEMFGYHVYRLRNP